MTTRIEALGPANLPDLLRFFEQRAFVDHPSWASCYRHFPHADHENEKWSDRTGEQNKAATCGRVNAGTMAGLLAYDGDEVIGWCNAGDRAWVTMVDDKEPADGSVASITCFVVAPDRRGQGIAGFLLATACERLRVQGFAHAEAYPLVGANHAAQERGPLPMYEKAGFTELGRDKDGGVVVRKAL